MQLPACPSEPHRTSRSLAEFRPIVICVSSVQITSNDDYNTLTHRIQLPYISTVTFIYIHLRLIVRLRQTDAGTGFVRFGPIAWTGCELNTPHDVADMNLTLM